ncbi:MAG: polya polymerase [Deltaproteobacteria bacterium]|nr:polya polymerase [Deltaproteobacteria bacterium]
MSPNGECPDVPPSPVPVIIPATDHPIKVHDIDGEALKVLYRLRDAGFAGYLVGGGVRDLYLGQRPKDFDISTNARPGQLRKLFRNSRTIGRRFRLVQVFFRGGKIIEVSTLRSRSEYDINDIDKVLPSNNTFGTLPEDAFRRDLTINSLFYEIENNTIIDYVGGVKDLDQGIIRIVGEPDRRVTRDPVRIMRVVRHAARNGFRIEEQSWQAIVRHRHKLDLCPPSRIRDELLRDLRGGKSEPWTRTVLKSRIFTTIMPFYAEILDGARGRQRQQELLALTSVLDRLHGQSGDDYRIEIPDYMLFTTLLVPWAEERFNLRQQRLHGPEHHILSRGIRAELDSLFSERFNIKRLDKEAITTLLVNLPIFESHQRKKTWPKWLRGKSYFADCSRFAGLFVEAAGGPAVDANLFAAKPRQARREAADSPGTDSGHGRRGRRGGRPAFSSRSKGVFGFRNG